MVPILILFAAAPLLPKVSLLSSSAPLAPASTRQAAAYGRPAAGDSVAVNVVFAATGGSVTSGGLYTAPASAGTFRIIATAGPLADTSTVTVTPHLASGARPDRMGAGGPGSGIPFGPFGALDGGALKANTGNFTMAMGSINAEDIIDRLKMARTRGLRLALAMTGGRHSNYMTAGVFDIVKWQGKMNTFDTPAIKAAVAAAVADGTIIGDIVMDEPHNITPASTWGPAGTMTKARVDEMCGYVKSIFPTLPVGVTHSHLIFEVTKSYSVCDFIVDQYARRKGEVTKFRDDGLAMGRRDGIAILFSLNILDGGEQLGPSCPIPQTGGRGTFARNCRMTADQVREYGMVLGPAGCGLTLWRYDQDFMSRPENEQAFKDVGGRLATMPAKPCRRS